MKVGECVLLVGRAQSGSVSHCVSASVEVRTRPMRNVRTVVTTPRESYGHLMARLAVVERGSLRRERACAVAGSRRRGFL